jgi:hypothetical protein
MCVTAHRKVLQKTVPIVPPDKRVLQLFDTISKFVGTIFCSRIVPISFLNEKIVPPSSLPSSQSDKINNNINQRVTDRGDDRVDRDDVLQPKSKWGDTHPYQGWI